MTIIQLSVVDISGIGPFDLWKAEMRRLRETFRGLASVTMLERGAPVGLFLIAAQKKDPAS